LVVTKQYDKAREAFAMIAVQNNVDPKKAYRFRFKEESIEH
jgi:hypothetical protein